MADNTRAQRSGALLASGSKFKVKAEVNLVGNDVIGRVQLDAEDGNGRSPFEEIAALRSALERIDRNFDLLLRGKPVRDVAETKAEVKAALDRLSPEKEPK